MRWWYFVPVAVIAFGGLGYLRYREARQFLDSLNGED